MRFKFSSVTVFLVFLFLAKITKAADSVTIESVNDKVEFLRQLNERTLNSIYWTLGSVLTLFAGVIAINIYSNYRLDRKKIEQIEKRLEKENKDKLANSEEKMFNTVNSKLLGLEKMVESSVAKHLNEVSDDVNKIKADFREVKREFLLIRIQKHKELKQKGEILTLIELLNFDMGGYDFQLHQTLDKLAEYVSSYRLTSDEITDLSGSLGKLDRKYDIQKNKILEKIKV